ncbi:MAG: arsenate reductase ArsC [Actinomycetota bacterium]
MKSWGQYQSGDELIVHAVDRLCDEFAGTFSPETVKRFVGESLDALSGAKVKNFLPLFTYRFAKERLQAHAQAEGVLMKEVPEVLFVCVHNAGRSQMAAALLDAAAGGKVHVRSAGSTPADEIHANVTAVMDEIGIDLSTEFPKPMTDEVVRAADVVITMGCGDACPIFPGKRYEDWVIEDPAGKPIDQVRQIRDEIAQKVKRLLAELVAA